MTTPLLDEGDSDLAWQAQVKRNQTLRNQDAAIDTVTTPTDKLDYDKYYETIDNIRKDSATITSGQIASDNQQKAYAQQQAAAARERQRQQALKEATEAMRRIASGSGFGQPGYTGGTVTRPKGTTGAGTGSYNGINTTWAEGDDAALADIIRAAGFPSYAVPIMMAIAKAESGGRANAINDKNSNGSVDRGLFQINSIHEGNSWYPDDPFDPLQSAQAAYAIWQGAGETYRDWTVFNSGKYKDYLPNGAVPAPRAVTIPSYVANTGSATGLRNTIVDKAMAFLGVPYAWGGESMGGTDCSGLVFAAYNAAGIKIPRVTANDYAGPGGGINGFRTTLDQLQPGDLVAWDHNRSGMPGSFVGHIAIYAGNGEIIEALGDGVPVHRKAISNYDHLIGIHVSLPGD